MRRPSTVSLCSALEGSRKTFITLKALLFKNVEYNCNTQTRLQCSSSDQARLICSRAGSVSEAKIQIFSLLDKSYKGAKSNGSGSYLEDRSD
jgi:hypothetical protein